MLYKARSSVIKLFDHYSLMVSEAKLRAKNKTSGKGLRILTPKQMLQRLPIDSSCTSKGKQQLRKLIKWDQANCLYFVSIKRNH